MICIKTGLVFQMDKLPTYNFTGDLFFDKYFKHFQIRSIPGSKYADGRSPDMVIEYVPLFRREGSQVLFDTKPGIDIISVSEELRGHIEQYYEEQYGILHLLPKETPG